MDDDTPNQRHVIGINTLSLDDNDGIAPSAEDIAQGDLGFVDVLKSLSNDRQRFIALALYQGWSKADIAFILGTQRPYIGHVVKEIQRVLIVYRIRYKKL